MENASEIQFDRKYRPTDNAELRGLFAAIEGFQIRKPRHPRKHIPQWALDDHSLRMTIIFPALRRYRIAYLYWHLGLSAREVAQEIGISRSSVDNVIHKLSKLSGERVYKPLCRDTD